MINFLSIEPNIGTSFNSKIKLFILCFLLSLLTQIIGALTFAVFSLIGIESVSTFLSGQPTITDFYNVKLSLLLILLVFPILEEFAFRGWFTRSRLLTSVSLTILLLYFLYVLIYRGLNYNFDFDFDNIFGLVIIAISLIAFSIYIYIKAQKIGDFIANNNKVLVLTSILSFSLIHVLNFNLSGYNFSTLVISLAVIIFPHPFSAYILTYIRIKNGVMWSIGLHILHNTVALMPVLLGVKDL